MDLIYSIMQASIYFAFGIRQSFLLLRWDRFINLFHMIAYEYCNLNMTRWLCCKPNCFNRWKHNVLCKPLIPYLVSMASGT